MKIIRKDVKGGIIEELEVSNVDIVKDSIVIKDPVFEKEVVKVKDVKVVEEKYPVKVPNFIKKDVFFDKLIITKTPYVVKVPELTELEGIITTLKKKIEEVEKTTDKVIKMNDAKIAGGVKTVTLYDFVYETKTIPKLREVDTPIPKLRRVDTPFPMLRNVDTPVDKVVYNEVIVDRPVYNTKEINTCIINHVCPHCLKKSTVPIKKKEGKKK